MAALHIGTGGGPAYTVAPWLETLADPARTTLLMPEGPPPPPELADLARIERHVYEASIRPRNPAEAARGFANLARQTWIFQRAMRRERPELAICGTVVLLPFLIAAKRERVPSILTAGEIIDGGWTHSSARNAAGRTLARIAGRLATVVAAVSDTAAEPYLRGSAPVVTAYPAIDHRFAEGDGEAFRDAFGLPSEARVVAVVGDVTEGRGQHIAIDAFAAVAVAEPNAHLVIVGPELDRPRDRGYAEGLRAQVSRLGLSRRVTLTGILRPVADALAAAEVVANPALMTEGFGRAQAEALLAGVPVVATRTGATPEVIADGETGLLVEPGDSSALSAAIIRLLSDRSLASRLAAAGRADVERRFSPQIGRQVIRACADDALRLAGGK